MSYEQNSCSISWVPGLRMLPSWNHTASIQLASKLAKQFFRFELEVVADPEPCSIDTTIDSATAIVIDVFRHSIEHAVSSVAYHLPTKRTSLEKLHDGDITGDFVTSGLMPMALSV